LTNKNSSSENYGVEQGCATRGPNAAHKGKICDPRRSDNFEWCAARETSFNL